MGADVHVRPGRGSDATRLGEIQSRVWRQAYAGLLPAETLAELDPGALADRWRAAIDDPPTTAHRVLVAVADGQVAGFAAVTPAEDPDLDPREDAELGVLMVDEPHQRAGHGSRLLAALVDQLRLDGYRVVYAWLAPTEEPLRALLESGGWGPDGANRSLDLHGDGDVVVRQVRLHTDISEEP